MEKTEERFDRIVLFAILAVAALLRLWGADWGLPHQYQTEEYRVIKYALRMGRGDLNPHIFEYPSLYLYFMLFLFGLYYLAGRALGLFADAQAFARSYVSDPTAFHLIGRVSEAAFSLAAVYLTYRLAKKMFGRTAAWIAALGLAVLPSAVHTSHATKGDMAAIFLALLFWSFCYEILESGKPRHYFLAGAALGLAFSTKYYVAMSGIALPVAHFCSRARAPHRYLLYSLLLIPLAFVAGTPYSVLTPEFIREFRTAVLAFGSGDTSFWESFRVWDFAKRFIRAGLNILRMWSYDPPERLGHYGLGLVNLAGLFWLVRRDWRLGLTLGAPVVAYWIVVGAFQNPAVGYLAPIFPLMMIAGAGLIAQCWPPRGLGRSLALALFAFSIFTHLHQSARMAYSYSLADTRTAAQEWIDQNLPHGSKVLIDISAYSPPLKMTRAQLQRFYDLAARAGHYKTEVFRLQLDTQKETDPAFHIYLAQRLPSELGVLPHHLEEVQKVQDLIAFSGDGSDWERIRKAGIQYIIVNSWSETNARTHYPRIALLYDLVREKGAPMKTFAPGSKLHPGPEIRIYSVEGGKRR